MQEINCRKLKMNEEYYKGLRLFTEDVKKNESIMPIKEQQQQSNVL